MEKRRYFKGDSWGAPGVCAYDGNDCTRNEQNHYSRYISPLDIREVILTPQEKRDSLCPVVNGSVDRC